MGFCLYGNVAVAAADAVDRLGLDRVLIVDFDVHHGNGTQEIFYDDPRVGFLSIHRYPFYPGTGRGRRDRDRAGARARRGTSRSPYGTSAARLPRRLPRRACEASPTRSGPSW